MMAGAKIFAMVGVLVALGMIAAYGLGYVDGRLDGIRWANEQLHPAQKPMFNRGPL